MSILRAFICLLGDRLAIAAVACTFLLSLATSARADDPAKTAAFIEVPEGRPATDYENTLRVHISDYIIAMGVKYVSPDEYGTFDRKQYTNHLDISIDELPGATRILVKMLDGESHTVLFTHAIWLLLEPGEYANQKIIRHMTALRKELTIIRTLYQLHTQSKGKPRGFADCIFPAADSDSTFSSFLTTNYPIRIQANHAFSKYKIFGILPGAFGELCKSSSSTPFENLAAFEFRIYGILYQGSNLYVAFQRRGSEPMTALVQVPPNWQAALDVVATKISAIVESGE